MQIFYVKVPAVVIGLVLIPGRVVFQGERAHFADVNLDLLLVRQRQVLL